jgi:acyl carrier protein
MTRESITEKVCAAFVEALGLDEDEVTPESRIFDDLGAESLDLLEIVFLLERGFDIKIPRGGVKEASQAGIDPSQYEVDGKLTELALEKLRDDVGLNDDRPSLSRLIRIALREYVSNHCKDGLP